ncbi:MAG: hypothetical protein KJ921_10955 [Proteobacteria bacterium]|nr:hypothetical protein [Pseudomonadota bacterium]
MALTRAGFGQSEARVTTVGLGGEGVLRAKERKAQARAVIGEAQAQGKAKGRRPNTASLCRLSKRKSP